MPKKVIKNPSGMSVIKFDNDPLAKKFVKITYGKRSILGKLLKIKKTRIINLPKNSKLLSISNNSPKVGFVTVKYRIFRARRKRR